VAGPILRSAGHDVVGLDADLFLGCGFGEAAAEIPAVRKDIRDLTRADLEGFDAVVHLAALSNDPLGAPSSTSARSSGLCWPCSKHRKMSLTTKRSTSASQQRTTAFANWLLSSQKRFPVPVSNTLPMAVRTNAVTASTATKSTACSRIFAHNEPPAEERRNSTRPIAPPASPGKMDSGRYVRMSHIQRLLKAGRLDDSLRFSQRHVEAVELA
jgi:hypothetical protein